MPFQNADANLIRRPEFIGIADDRPTGGLSTVLSAAVAAGATSIDVTSAGAFTAGVLRIGSGEVYERVDVVSAVSNTLTLRVPLTFDHVIDSPVVEQLIYNLGDVDGDITITPGQESTDQQSAMRLLTYAILRGNVSVAASFRLLGTTLANFALSIGLPYARLTGSSTSADPLIVQTDFNDVDTATNRALIVVSKRRDGSRVIHELWSLATDYTGVAINFARGQNGAVPVSVMALSAMSQEDLAIGAPLPFATSNAFRATNGTLFRELREVGVFEATGAVSTLNEGGGDGNDGDAGEKVLTLSGAITGLVADGFVAIGVDDLVEVHQVGPTPGASITLKTGLFREQANGTPVQRAIKIPFFTVTPGGVTFNVGGSTAPIPSELRDLPIAMQPGSVQATFGFATNDLLKENVARAMGVPVSQIVGNRVLLSKLIASRRIIAAYFEGVTQNGLVCRIIVWGASQEIASFAIALGATTPAQVPYSLRPASGVQFAQWVA